MKATKTATPRGGYGFDIKLTAMRDTPAVVWVNSNSYVTDGTDTYSINGIGEIRWKVERWNPEYRETRDYFGLDIDRGIIAEHGCCDKAELVPCVCSYAFRCPVHGAKHVGTHD